MSPSASSHFYDRPVEWARPVAGRLTEFQARSLGLGLEWDLMDLIEKVGLRAGTSTIFRQRRLDMWLADGAPSTLRTPI